MEEEKLVQAVQIASNPTLVQDQSLPPQALQWLEHLKSVTHESWSVGWSVYSARSEDRSSAQYGDQVRLFGLNLVAEFLENHVSEASDPATAIDFLRQAVFAYVNDEFVCGKGERSVVFIKNKFAQVVTLLLLQTYNFSQHSSAFLPELISLCRVHSQDSGASQASPVPLNLTATDLVLRVLHDLSITLGSDATLRSVRTRERLQRDSAVRDEIRANHVVGLAESVWSIIEETMQKAAPDARHDPKIWDPVQAGEVLDMAVAVIGDYVSWIDISLVVMPHTISLFFALLNQPWLRLKKTAAEALYEVISKGMKAAGKLELLQVLNLTSVVSAAETAMRPEGSSEVDEMVEVREKLAKLANGATLELVKVAEDTAADENTRVAAGDMLLQHMPLVLAFLADEYDEPAELVLSGLNAFLAHLKKLKKKHGSVSEAQLDFLTKFVDVTLQKMKYDESAEWTGAGTSLDKESDGGFSDEDEAHFVELRKQLQVLLGATAAIEETLFAARAQSLILETLAANDRATNGGGLSLTWQQAELAVFVAYFYVEILISAPGQPKVGVNPNAFVQLPADATRTRNKLSHGVYPTLPLSSLGQTVQTLVKSSISAFPHPAVQLQFFECLNRYSPFFITRPDELQAAMFAFLDSRGVYNAKPGARQRVWYLFSRFIKEVSIVVPPEWVQRVLDSLRDILVVKAELPMANADEDPLMKARDSTSEFDAQVYLFETCGILIGLLTRSSEPEQSVAVLKAVCDPLTAQLRTAAAAAAQNTSDVHQVLQVHHLMLAMSNLAKGFPDMTQTSAPPTSNDQAWMAVFKEVTEQILMVLGPLSQHLIIREAARGAFSRIVATTGQAVLPLIPNLIQGLLEHLSSNELVDFLSFLGLIVAKYRDNVFGILDELFLLLLGRIFHFLNQEVSGTDDAVERAELQAKYVNFLSVLVNNGLDGVLVSERNGEQMQTVLQSVVHYAEHGEVTIQRSAFSILSRLVNIWCADQGSSSAPNAADGSGRGNLNGHGTASIGGGAGGQTQSRVVPGFETFVFDTVIPLAFTVPAKSSFDFSDATTQLVFTEIAQLFKIILAKLGPQNTGRWLLDVWFPRIQCPPDMATDFVNNLQTLEAKKWKAYLQGFISSSRGG